ncbi:NAD-dependent epimerase/dehydratase family protein [Tropicimonas isoalkanivorans]|uniref:Nucleoside-diphosphate-sugar epimerase n=1 Tax=Tropicimonas isoalkanivorans TaxID=441112 RepID=A0A1I1NPI5_9RHOB|nr:NAD(P)-dependent oxidoreductase [Tropicimonas isoalkanivorans]SFC97408.1 Nucleoside-diphosphate-sugar epimerase [Tropicimonas isoalkanivorans]
MRLAVTGGTGLVGRFIVEEALAAGDDVAVLSRSAPLPGNFGAPVVHVPYDLAGPVPPLVGYDALVHAAFSHLAGRYRGGEGGDPAGFLRANLDGSVRLFEAAKAAGVGRVLFLSSRAAYGAWPPGTVLREDMEPRPDTLYGEAKVAAERALTGLTAPGFATSSLRATGVYGAVAPGQAHKWQPLFADFQNGTPIAPRVATEVHGADLASAVRLLLTLPADELAGAIFNVSDLILDRRDLLAEVARLTGVSTPLPDRADAGQVNVMETRRLEALGWRPAGMEGLRQALPAMLRLD